ncbi:MAG: hypothetical protein LLG20_07935 [Acidobacteriales bacterium]|nr:hypothetical protein [Terriglobales bacterium]
METQSVNSKSYCFCTLALGAPYGRLAVQLASDLAGYSPHAQLLVLTDQCSLFTHSHNVLAIPHRQRSVAAYNDKLCVVNKALKLFRTCIFLDADTRILAPVRLTDDVFEPGVKGRAVFSWQDLKDTGEADAERAKRRKNRMMSLLRNKLQLSQPDSELVCVLESLFSVTHCTQLSAFLSCWNQLALYCEEHRMFAYEGVTIGAAAFVARCPVAKAEFDGVKVFEPIASWDSIARGEMTHEEYERWNVTISRYKDAVTGQSALGRGLTRSKRRVVKGVRFLKVRLCGFDLLK